MKKATFEATVLPGHKDLAVEVPFDPAVRWEITARPLWPGRRGYQVIGKVAEHRFESAIVPRSKRFYLLLAPEVCRSARISVGDAITVTVLPSP